VSGGVSFAVNGTTYTGPISTTAGTGYTVTPAAGSNPTPTSGNPLTSTPPPTTSPGGCTAARYAQCGGNGWTGCTSCQSPWTCQFQNDWYSQCL
jgi:hypothetical protein